MPCRARTLNKQEREAHHGQTHHADHDGGNACGGGATAYAAPSDNDQGRQPDTAEVRQGEGTGGKQGARKGKTRGKRQGAKHGAKNGLKQGLKYGLKNGLKNGEKK